ncbi:BadF/BadG/BcrA/BcrD ATPase family protein [Aquisalimonas sp.]|uniref:BadF/BadG/BcrA/BcrD ATPase family protein n=1 Tax=Aquisalimonas sp. TaxID=1872621 RepID=UPI0025B9824D|nr:BadF/BadG/BcrA/BcrD ATPase family protein [Aquisalimonas sp.]
MNERFYLGVDGGGTACRARIYDCRARPLGEGRAQGASVRLGVQTAWRQILQATHGALRTAGLDREILARTRAGLGLAGAVDPEEWLRVAAYPHPFAGVEVVSDAHTAVLGAFAGDDGGVLIIGTGSCGMALVEGRFHRVGGWGFPVSDHASGAWLGLRALRAALLCQEGLRPPSALCDRILRPFDHCSPAVMRWQYTAQPRDYARFAQEVFAAADEGDTRAKQLLEQAASEAAMLAEGVFALGAPRLCVLGGVGRALISWLPVATRRALVTPRGDAMDGARLLVQEPNRVPSP